MLVSVSLHPHPGASLAVVHGPHGDSRPPPASPRGGCRQHIHPRRPKRASFPRASLDSLPRPASRGALLTCASCRRRVCPCGIGARRQRTGGPRGVVGEPESLNKARGRFNNPRVRSPPASFATAHQQSVGTQAMRALGPGREGLTALAPAPTQPHSYSDLKSSKRTR